MLQQRPNTFAQTILSLSFFACDKAADHTLPTNQDLAVRRGGTPGLPFNEKACLLQREREPFVLMRMAAGKENKKQLDMLTSAIVNYNSVVGVHLS
jgi:hypothetical protein